MSFIPGAKAAKAADHFVDATKAARACKVSSFVPGTRVLMADGSNKPIEDVKVGDQVLATDPTTGETSAQTVVGTIITQGRKDLVKLTVDADGPVGDGTGTVVATADHPVWSADENQWLQAGALQAGDDLRALSYAAMEVISTSTYRRQQKVHNLTVAGIHTYYVLAGDTPVLVHNSGGACKEVTLPSFDSFEQARNKALDLLGEVDPATRQPYIGRLDSAPTTYGKVVGFTTRVNGEFKRFRMDYDPVKGPHVNVEVGKGDSARKWAVPWNGTEDDFARMLGGNS